MQRLCFLSLLRRSLLYQNRQRTVLLAGPLVAPVRHLLTLTTRSLVHLDLHSLYHPRNLVRLLGFVRLIVLLGLRLRPMVWNLPSLPLEATGLHPPFDQQGQVCSLLCMKSLSQLLSFPPRLLTLAGR